MPIKENLPECAEHNVHKELVSAALAAMPSAELLYDLSDFFKLFGDSTRLAILLALDGAELCVCELAEVVGLTKSAVSHQLKSLRQNNLVRYRREGKNVIYSLADSHVKDIIDLAIVHINE